MLQVLLITLALVQVVVSTSNSESVGLCDAHSPLFGCALPFPKDRKGVEQRLSCPQSEKDAGKIMHWATAAKHTDTYRLWVGDESKPLTSYIPGELHEIHIKVTKHRQMYRGLLLYAAKDGVSPLEKVGSWELPEEEPALFQIASSCPDSVMHASAVHKPYHVIIHWRAPAAGAGKVKFECLLKQGDANHGEFFWPNAAGVVTLNEGSARKEGAVTWFRGLAGQDCNTVCAAQGKKCDTNNIKTLTSPAALKGALGHKYLCKLPYVRQCGAIGPTSSSDNFCYYHDMSVCSKQGVAAQEPSCSAKSSNNQDGFRFCPCSGSGSVVTTTTKAPPKTTVKTTGKPATTTKPGTKCPPAELNCACSSAGKCLEGSCKNNKCVATTTAKQTTTTTKAQPTKPGDTTAATTAGETTLPTTTLKTVYPTALYTPSGCKNEDGSYKFGAKGCRCVEADNSCLAERECYEGFCIPQSCNGELNCSCHSGKCFDNLICAVLQEGSKSGVCVMPLAPVTDATETAASSASSVAVCIFAAFFALVATLF